MSRVLLRLYIAGDAPNSVAARANLRRLLDSYAPGACSIEVVDCLKAPMRALQEGVLVTPTLVRLEPGPVRTIIGSLSDTTRVLETLGLGSTAGAPEEA